MNYTIVIFILFHLVWHQSAGQALDSASQDTSNMLKIVNRTKLNKRINFRTKSDSNQLRAQPKIRVLVTPMIDLTTRSQDYTETWYHDLNNVLESLINRCHSGKAYEHFEFFYAGCYDPGDIAFDAQLNISLTNFERHEGTRRLIPNEFAGYDEGGSLHYGEAQYALDFTRFRLKAEVSLWDSRTCQLLSNWVLENTHEEPDSRNLLSGTMEVIPKSFHDHKATEALSEELGVRAALDTFLAKIFRQFMHNYGSSIITRRNILKRSQSSWR